MKVELFCICGAGAEGEIAPDSAADRFRSFWDQFHKGQEHRPCPCHEAAETCSECRSIDAAIDVFGKFISPEDKPASYDITCICGGVMKVFWRQDHSRGINCASCHGNDERPHATATPRP